MNYITPEYCIQLVCNSNASGFYNFPIIHEIILKRFHCIPLHSYFSSIPIFIVTSPGKSNSFGEVKGPEQNNGQRATMNPLSIMPSCPWNPLRWHEELFLSKSGSFCISPRSRTTFTDGTRPFRNPGWKGVNTHALRKRTCVLCSYYSSHTCHRPSSTSRWPLGFGWTRTGLKYIRAPVTSKWKAIVCPCEMFFFVKTVSVLYKYIYSPTSDYLHYFIILIENFI